MAALLESADPDFADELGEVALVDVCWPASLAPPLASDCTFGQMRAHLHAPHRPAHPLCSLRLAPSTLKGHARALARLAAAPAEFDGWACVDAILELHARHHREKRIRWSTLLRQLAEVQGALAALPVSHGKPAISLSRFPAWVAALKGVAIRSREERPRAPAAASAADISAAIELEPSRAVKQALCLAWLLCGRVGDIRRLRAEDVTFARAEATDAAPFTVTFRRGKTVSRRGPYSLHSLLPAAWTELFDGPLLVAQATVPALLAALRRVRPHLENRSVRRGALQRLAEAGNLSEDELLLFSGHTSLGSLRRYLLWGAVGDRKRRLMTSAAATLAPPTVAPAPPVSAGTGDPPHLHTSPKHERWLQFLGAEAPPFRCLPGVGLHPASPLGAMPMASKDVAAAINVFAVPALVRSPELRTFVESTLRWTYDDTKFLELLATPPTVLLRRRASASCRLLPAEIALQLRLGKYSIADPSTITSWCRVFTLPQPIKRVKRHICEPLLNDLFTSTPTVRFRTAAERRAAISRFQGGWAVSLDLASFFDQIPLGEKVRRFFGIRAHGQTLTMSVLPMGFRPSAQIGQAITWAICDIPPSADDSWTLLSYIDNILVLARSKEEAERIARLLIDRAASIGAVFNDVAQGVTASQSFDFLGGSYDLVAGSVKQTEKTATKVAVVESFLTSSQHSDSLVCSRRDVAAMVGLFLFASSSCAVAHDLPDYYSALRFYRDYVASGTCPWDAPVAIGAAALRSFRAWAAALRANPGAAISGEASLGAAPDVLFVDSSEQRWAVVHLRDSHVSVYSEEWSDDDRRRWDLRSSVASEPLGLQRALCRCIAPAATTGVVVYTDHEPAVWAVASPCAKGYSYALLQQFLRRFPAPVTLRHIPGEMHPADTFTRSAAAPPTTAFSSSINAAVQFHDHAQQQALLRAAVSGEDGKRAEWALTARNPSRTLNCCSGRRPPLR
jgi:integrase